MLALVFPGQGSQYGGMGADLLDISPAAIEILERADEALGMSLSGLCITGDDVDLMPTEVAQPALLAVSYAWLCAAGDQFGPVGVVAGHSLGEYTALVAAGALEFETAVRLVRRRGELMRDAARERPGAMLAVLKLDLDLLERLCDEVDGVVVPANYNAPGQVVVSGEPAAIEALAAKVVAAGGRARELAVSGAFHSPLMEPAAIAMREELDQVAFNDAAVPVIQNVTGRPTTAAAELRENLARQVTGRVRWVECVRAAVDLGVDRLIEVGPGQVLTGLSRRIAPEVRCYNLGDRASFEGLAQWLENGV